MAEKSHFDLIYGESLLPVLQSLPTKSKTKTKSSGMSAAGAAANASAAAIPGMRDKPIRRPDSHTLNPNGAPRKGIAMLEEKKH